MNAAQLRRVNAESFAHYRQGLIDLLLDAVPALLSHRPNLRVLLVGGGLRACDDRGRPAHPADAAVGAQQAAFARLHHARPVDAAILEQARDQTGIRLAVRRVVALEAGIDQHLAERDALAREHLQHQRMRAIEGGLRGEGDRHVIVIDRDRNRLYELFKAYPDADGGWRAASAASSALSQR